MAKRYFINLWKNLSMVTLGVELIKTIRPTVIT